MCKINQYYYHLVLLKNKCDDPRAQHRIERLLILQLALHHTRSASPQKLKKLGISSPRVLLFIFSYLQRFFRSTTVSARAAAAVVAVAAMALAWGG